jgi:FlaA1/EpsC-like NDP-sugar epimerase
MLQRDQQFRTQIHQVADACLFAVSFWMAFALRVNPQIIAWLDLDPIPLDIFDRVLWLYFFLIPTAPLILESQGFYNHPVLCSRRDILWPLFKGCSITTIGLVLVMYVFHIVSPRGVMVFFGSISFSLVYLKEELVRWALHSKFAQLQYKRRFILIATGSEIVRLRRELKKKADQSVEIVTELSLGETPVQQLV